MKRLLLFPFILLYNLITGNMLKIIWTILAIIGFSCSQFYKEDDIEKKTAKYVAKVDNKYTYFFLAGDDSYSTIVTDKPLKNNTYIYTTTQGEYIFLQVLGWFSIFILVVCFFIGLGGDEDAAWEIDKVFQESLNFLIECEFEDSKFIYIAVGRLLGKTDRQLYRGYGDNIAEQLNIRNFTDILNCPKFKTKSQKRSELLNKKK